MAPQDKTRQLAEDGWCVIPGVLSDAEADDVRAHLWAAAEESERRGAPTRNIGLDPNRHNVRVFNLIDIDPVFIELIQHPLALELVHGLMGQGVLVSNFTANIALPGSGSMELHSDQSIVVPAPWVAPWSMNIIWCLNDVREENGATRYLPGSHLYETAADVPADALARMRPFEAPKGSIIAMDGRLWHTSGANRTADEERALLFGYYCRDFLRPQQNWNAALSPGTIEGLSPAMRALLGLDASANVGLAQPLLKHLAGDGAETVIRRVVEPAS
jgi:ectoine hydroxylase-related dioxygenase (phytanoyl-CoA dioxygenase family)